MFLDGECVQADGSEEDGGGAASHGDGDVETVDSDVSGPVRGAQHLGGGTGGGSGTASQISSWIESTFTAQTIDGVTVYDLTTGS